ncbi:Jag family protein [Desulfobulbus oligotrophicus]|uniref:RNA-binding protein KhpB n=1 Tax=Desulfobulbus oligotrophicus TaxID=1909699 RepID=A0A7T5VCL7_9BACT|nr:protein jag [Desulfobulbus oligotrophicus]QQG65410.1 Jag N-terminal domain-containing protein [Desulfobulbus oligotrophicus]
MSKGKDFYGKDITEVIEQACTAFGVAREELDIEVLETGSAGIFGLCKKKAHIRARRRVVSPEGDRKDAASVDSPSARHTSSLKKEKASSEQSGSVVEDTKPLHTDKESDEIKAPLSSPPQVDDHPAADDIEVVEEDESKADEVEEEHAVEPPTAEKLAAIQADLHQLLSLMGLPSDVKVVFQENTVLCNISGRFEEQIVGPEGRTLDSLQYLLRKMVAPHLGDRIMLALNAGGFRERRAKELKVRALELAGQVKKDGKTLSIPALNPSERRVVHMALQDDKVIRSRSVGEGLFKKVLIYKPGKSRRTLPKKRRGDNGGRSSGD